MRVKVISRVEEDYTRECKTDALRVHRNLDPELRPMQRATEYKRALNAVKLDKVFAKPLVGQFGGHADGVLCMAKSPTSLTELVSGDASGEIRIWDVPSRKTLRILSGHRGATRACACRRMGNSWFRAVTTRRCGVDASEGTDGDMSDPTRKIPKVTTTAVWQQDNGFRDCDAHWGKNEFATAGATVQVWNMERGKPMHTFEWGVDTVLSVRWNPVESDIFASCGTDRSVALYDVRMETPLRKIIMQTKSTKLCWNPMEAFNFTVANEDTNLYSYDMRKMDIATYDRTIRIFDYNAGHSKDCYHTKRMQRVFCTRFSMDGTFKHMPEIRRIANHHHVPKAIHKATKLRRTMQDAETRKAKRRVAHAAPGAEKKEFKPARKKKILAEVE
ncbi:WD40-repeat-containing domain protein [Ostreococcus tauri]|uniref:WD40-repeat-containing domain protein n=1 Tax=Ostreococcus tauri TaxID=70448 RepID=A0A1Y5I0W7_OSTTA|nr:WD40-repeat-containing domain protein [Ostreococcus tauri]